jgi:hypothetical protein
VRRVKRTTLGKIRLSASAAAAAFGFPPSSESSNSNSGCLAGFEKETFAESTKVMFRTPQPYYPRMKEIKHCKEV